MDNNDLYKLVTGMGDAINERFNLITKEFNLVKIIGFIVVSLISITIFILLFIQNNKIIELSKDVSMLTNIIHEDQKQHKIFDERIYELGTNNSVQKTQIQSISQIKQIKQIEHIYTTRYIIINSDNKVIEF